MCLVDQNSYGVELHDKTTFNMKMKVVVVISIFGAEEGGTIWAMCVCWDNWFTVHNMDAF